MWVGTRDVTEWLIGFHGSTVMYRMLDARLLLKEKVRITSWYPCFWLRGQKDVFHRST